MTSPTPFPLPLALPSHHLLLPPSLSPSLTSSPPFSPPSPSEIHIYDALTGKERTDRTVKHQVKATHTHTYTHIHTHTLEGICDHHIDHHLTDRGHIASSQ